ncbi:DUF3418 domain-containing protein, partial [Corynebacterium diphtheriae]
MEPGRSLKTCLPCRSETCSRKCQRYIKQQLSNLVYPGFVRETPAQWFKELPRYLKAI